MINHLGLYILTNQAASRIDMVVNNQNARKHFSALAQACNLRFVSLYDFPSDSTLLEKSKCPDYLKLQTIPVSMTEKSITVATANPTNENKKRIIKFFNNKENREIVIVVTTRQDIVDILAARFEIEIGATWLAKSRHHTGINTEVKLLLLQYAFEELYCNAVEFRTHFFNHQSRKSIERLGAKLDGILRNHMVMSDGTLRDTCVYSILKTEWFTVKAHLTFLNNENHRVRIK